jgi:hypothetical protein
MPKTLTISLLVMLCIFQFGCEFEKAPQKNISPKEFEGIIAYHEIIKDIRPEFNLEDTVYVFYSHGNYVGVHTSMSPNFHVVKDYYLKDGTLRLLLFNASDTLYQIKLNSSTERLDSFNIEKTNDKILSKKCERIDIKTSYQEKDSTTYSDFTFTFSRDMLNVNKEHFKNWRLGFFNKVIDKSGAFYLKLKAVHFDGSHKNVLWSKTYDVISVKEVEIDQRIFKIGKAKIK